MSATRSSRGWPRRLLAFVVVLAVLLGARWEVLGIPPYDDAAMGLWREADFLARTRFDYAALHAAKGFHDGGPQCYFISVLPSILAAVMLVAPSPAAAIAVAHLLNLAAAAVLIVLFWELLAPQIGGLAAALTAAAAMSVPLAVVQIDFVGMEIAMAVFCVWAVLLLVRQRYVASALAAAAGFFMKPTASLMNMALAAYLAARLAAGAARQSSAQRRQLAAGLAVNLAALAVHAAILWWQGAFFGRVVLRHHRPEVLDLLTLPAWSPDLALLLVLALVSTVLLMWRGAGDRPDQAGEVSAAAALDRVLAAQPTLVVSWLVVIGMLLAIVRVLYVPRYVLVAVPFLLAIVGLATCSRPRWRPAGLVLLGAIVVLNLANLHGRFYPDVERVLGREYARLGCILERSLEYRGEQQATQQAIALIEREYPSTPVVALRPIIDFLALPSLGYVSAPLRGYSGSKSTHPEFPEIGQWLIDQPADPIYFYKPTNVEAGVFEIPPPDAHDQIIAHDQDAAPLILYRKRDAGGRPLAGRALEDWFLEHLFPGLAEDERNEVIAFLLLRAGRLERGLNLLRQDPAAGGDPARTFPVPVSALYRRGRIEEALEAAIDAPPLFEGDPVRYARLRIDQLESLAAQPAEPIERVLACDAPPASCPQLARGWKHLERDQIQQALELLTAAAEACPDDPQAALAAGLAELFAGHSAAAMQRWWRAADAHPGAVPIRLVLAVVLSHRGLWSEAARQLEPLAAAAGSSALVEGQLARVALATGQPARAEAHLRRAVELAPRYGRAWHELGVLLAESGRRGEAAAVLETAVEVDPGNRDARLLLDRCRQRADGPAQAATPW